MIDDAIAWLKQKATRAGGLKQGQENAGNSKDWVIQAAGGGGGKNDVPVSSTSAVQGTPSSSSKSASGINDMVIPDGMNLVDDAYEEKMAAFEVDCNDGGGSGTACHHVAEFYSVVKDEHNRAKRTFEINCHRTKDPYYASCFNLGKLYLAGRGNIKQDDKLAASNFKRACEHGHLQACYHSGVFQYLLHDGTTPGETKNEIEQAEAIKVLEKSCKDGEIDSCYFAGTHYLNKATSDKYRSPKKAVELLKVACNSNHAPSCFNLAVVYNHGDNGVSPDKNKYDEFRRKTQQLVGESGSLKGTKTA